MNPKIILLVEDNPSEIALTQRAIEKTKIDHEVVLATDGQAALDYLFAEGSYAGRDLSIQPSLVLLDLKMPKVGGMAVLKKIKSDPRTKAIPVIILTSSNEETDRANCYEFGVNSYIRKPVNFDQFTAAIAQLGLYWLVLNEPKTGARK